ncbi:UbiA prenyltransferase family protein [Actinomadura macrotermitis]|uniref:Prenyltransferase n=1 Tax=Actinomadura macrotermitis TaxID=2585200 RepID=A0A7K0BNV2_9ACTN|nr:UbiA prenyltransferase family protein [Actinomadura macrotermitis]MQY02880.1 hypothetical protein [Actinomadura macrotermitis]
MHAAAVPRTAAELWRVARPALWPVSLVPCYVGHLLATRSLLPVPAAPALAGAAVWGPLGWLAVLAVNDAADVAGDRRNPRKAGAPLAGGRLSVRAALVAAHLSAAAAMAVALTLRPAFALVTAGFLILGWLYSLPPVRLKDRPGLDVATNAVAVGALAPMAGWAAVRPLAGFPWVMAVLGVLVAVALYVPTAVADHGADVASGYTTVAVRFGPRGALRAGLAAWTAACALAAALAATGQVFPQRTWWAQAASAPVLVVLYHRRLGRARGPGEVVRGITVVSWAFLVPCAVFALAYAGVL